MPPAKGARIVLYDLETSQDFVSGYGNKWEFKVMRIITPSKLMCYSYKWLGERKTYFVSMHDFPTYVEFIQSLSDVLDSADIAIAHNGIGFDNKVATTLFLLNGVDQPSPYRVIDTLRIYADMLTGVRVNQSAMYNAAMRGYATATDLADYLAKKGLPFREAHEIVAQAVRFADSSSRDLSALTLPELQRFSPLIEDNIFAVLTLEGSINSRNHIGGTAPAQVSAAIGRARNYLS